MPVESQQMQRDTSVMRLYFTMSSGVWRS